MNTSRKGNDYEWACKRHLIACGATWVMRAAASHGPFDLLAVFPDAVIGYQLKFSKMTCRRAIHEAAKLPQAWNCLARFVHPTKEKRFCEH